MMFNKIIFLFAVSIFTIIKAEEICKNGSDCLNNGVCNVEIKNGIKESYCSCPQNFHGKKCQYRRCTNNPCQNNGICESFGRSIKCHCSKFYMGDFCQYRKATACDFMECGNGKCILLADSLELGMCECNEGFRGIHCSIVEACKLDSCNFRGECISDGASSFACKCDQGFTGDFCETQIDYCKNHTCFPGSKCINELGYKTTFSVNIS
uniref:EGF-like domain-containing protein n=1 Tax=Panagrolaimus davidi TaxID=227884 RepID=A0A914QU88_9BILA